MKSFLSLPVGSKILVTVFILSGIGHLVNPTTFLNLIPPFLPSPYFWIYASGVAELACAVGLLMRSAWAPLTTVVLLLVVWVGNWWFAIDLSSQGYSTTLIAAWARIPLQIPLIWWAYRSPVRQ
jgi:uncharacterized membrane protein